MSDIYFPQQIVTICSGFWIVLSVNHAHYFCLTFTNFMQYNYIIVRSVVLY